MANTPQGSAKNLVIETLNNKHGRAQFSCGENSLDEYIKKQAKQDVKRRISRVYVATDVQRPESIQGYYTLSSLSIELDYLPEALLKKLPRHPVPAALIGRLAVSESAQGSGIGKMMLVDAIKRTLAVSEDIAIYAMVVDAINAEAQSFYERYGFKLLKTGNSRLFLPLKSL